MTDPPRDPLLPGHGSRWTLHGTVIRRQRAFDRFHRQHPEVYTELVRRCRMMQREGLAFGLRTLWEAMRWDFAVSQPPRPFKLNNNHASFYARLIMEREPGLDGIFKIRGGDV